MRGLLHGWPVWIWIISDILFIETVICSSFQGIVEQDALFLYLEHLLAPKSRQSADYAQIPDVTHTLHKAKQTIQALDKTEALYKQLEKILQEVLKTALSFSIRE